MKVLSTLCSLARLFLRLHSGISLVPRPFFPIIERARGREKNGLGFIAWVIVRVR